MGLTKTLFRLLAAFLLTGAGLYAQNAPGQLGAEIQSIAQKLTPAASPAERHDALVRLARLRQLSGSIAEAAAHWLDAAAADPRDDAALVSGAYCLAAVGEWDAAAAALRPLLAAGRAGPVTPQVRFLDACLRAWSSGDASALAALAAAPGADTPGLAALRPLIYYTLWRTAAAGAAAAGAAAAGAASAGVKASAAAAAESWKARLLAEFPHSPEARAAHADPLVSIVQSPLWQFLPNKVAIPPPPTPPHPSPATPATPPPAPTHPAAAAPPPAPTHQAAAVSTAATAVAVAPATATAALQTGLFSKESNARAQAEALRAAGFAASLVPKQVNGGAYWAVIVAIGLEQRAAIAALKKAGFDSFPVP